MLNKLELRNPQGDMLSLPFDDPSAGYVVQEITGLDPVKATLVSSSFAQQDGAQYHSSRREPRNIVMTLGLEPDYVDNSVKDLRDRLYLFLMPKSEVNLRFYDPDEDLVVEIVGRVETFEAPLFAAEPEANFSIMCFSPDFLDLDNVVIEDNTVSDTTEIEVEYAGTVDAGLTFVLNIDRTLSEFTFYHRPPDGTLRSMEVAGEFEAGDVLTISTVTGNKFATLTRSGTQSSALNNVSPQSNWAQFVNGTNKIRIYAEGTAIPYTITYTPRYGGL